MSVVSKNLYELLGNDPELDPNREPEPPTKVIDKPAARAGKRNAGADAPVKDAPAVGGRRQDNFTGSERAIRDKTAGSSNNRSKPTDDGLRRDRHPDRTRDSTEHRDANNRGRGPRGGRGGRGGARTGDRHDRSGVAAPHTNDKQAAHGWGGETGDAELSDEKAGLADAHAEEKKEGVVADSTAPVNAEGETVEVEEDNSKSYEQYLAEQLEKKAALGGGSFEPRKPNEGSSKNFPEGKAFTREEEDFVSGAGGKAKRERERKAKNVVDVDLSWKEEQAGGERSERGGAPRGGRGGRGRGGPRGGDRGGERGPRGGDRGDRRRGGGDRPQGDRPQGDRPQRDAAPRNNGPRSGAAPNVTNASDFPSLS